MAGQIIQDRLREKNYRGARGVIDLVESQFGTLPLTVVDEWRERFEKGAAAQVRRGERLLSEKNYREARTAAGQAQAIWPESAEAQELLKEIQRLNPSVVVGVRTTARLPLRPRIDSPASLRTSYLASPTLTRIADYSPEGGIYASPIGLLGLDATGSELSIEVLDYPRGTPAALDAPAAVARWLLRAADPDDAQHVASLAAVVGKVLTPEPDVLVLGCRGRTCGPRRCCKTCRSSGAAWRRRRAH